MLMLLCEYQLKNVSIVSQPVSAAPKWPKKIIIPGLNLIVLLRVVWYSVHEKNI